MIVIARTEEGVLIKATDREVKEILSATTGVWEKDDILIGQKIPAIDYAATIRKLRGLPEEYQYTSLMEAGERLIETLDEIRKAVQRASEIEPEN